MAGVTNPEAVQWLGLGLALGNRTLLRRLLTENSASSFDLGPARSLFAALGQGEQDVRGALLRLGVTCREGVRPADAVLDLLADRGTRAKLQDLADEIALKAKLMPADQLAELLERKLLELRGGKAAVLTDVVPFPAAKTGT